MDDTVVGLILARPPSPVNGGGIGRPAFEHPTGHIHRETPPPRIQHHADVVVPVALPHAEGLSEQVDRPAAGDLTNEDDATFGDGQMRQVECEFGRQQVQALVASIVRR